MTSQRPAGHEQMNIAVLVSGGGNHQGAWRRARSNIELANTPGFYVDFARKAEAAKIDAQAS